MPEQEQELKEEIFSSHVGRMQELEVSEGYGCVTVTFGFYSNVIEHNVSTR